MSADLKKSSQTVMKFQRAVAKAADIKYFTKSFMWSLDSFLNQVRETYESYETAMDMLSRAVMTQTTVL